MIILFLIYTLILEIIYFLLSPILFAMFRLKPCSERLAVSYPKKRYDVLIHAASVGEINGIKQLVTEFANIHRELHILITTNTITGREAAKSIHSNVDVMLSPLDVLHLRKKQFNLSKPSLIIITETEIWPTLLYCSKIYNVPVVFVNARMTEKTYLKYKKFTTVLKWLGTNIKAICTQSDDDNIRFSTLFDSKCINAGNLKFNVQLTDYNPAQLRSDWGYKENDKIIVIGSSRPGEEKLIVDSFNQLSSDFTDLKLIIVPRHLKRLDEIEKLIKSNQLSVYSRNQIAKDIHIIDKMGLLHKAYAICDIAVIGGSFYPFGGHNPLEAAFYSKAIIMGQHYSSCKESVVKLQMAEGIILSSASQLTNNLNMLLKDAEKYSVLGERAKRVLEENKDSLNKHLEILENYLV